MALARTFVERRIGANVLLADGSTVVADEAYIRESILQPKAKIVAGYQPVMPTFQGLITEEQILNLTAYIQSLQSQPRRRRTRELRRRQRGRNSMRAEATGPAPQLPEKHYLNATYGIRSWLLTNGPQADCAALSGFGDFFSFYRRILRDDDPPAPA